MIKDILTQNETIKPNSRRLEVLKEHFAGCFTKEGVFDVERFKEMIHDEVDITQEGYSLDFLGRDYANLIASIDTTTVIEPDEEHNSKPENKDSENIYISGDNLDALKHLLNSYEGKVKCIYIDPPYNTGTDGFVYNDKFHFTAEDLIKKLSIDEDEAQRIIELTSKGSSTHSAWLMFMSPRLQLARDLLSKDGVIFISIDDNEQANLKLLCDYIFGEENFVATFPRITKRGGKSSETIALNHDYVLVYSKTDNPKYYPLSHNDSGFRYRDEFFEERGLYKLNQTLDYDSLQYSSSLDYPLEIDGETYYPGGDKTEWEERQKGNHDRADWAWRWSKEKFDFGYKNGFVVVKKGRNGTRIYTKTYQKATIEEIDDEYVVELGDRTKSMSTLELTENGYSNDIAAKDLDKTIGKKIFDYSKPVSLISILSEIALNDNDIILDFFSGSGTTAESVFWNNVYNDTNIRFILVQLPELIKEGTAAYKKGYRTIDDIGINRIKRASQLVQQTKETDKDLGFKHYTLRETPDNVLDKLEEFRPDMANLSNNILDMFGRETVLETWKVRDGYGMNAKVEPVQLANYTAYQCGDHLYLTDEGMTNEAITALIDKYGEPDDWGPHYVVVFGYSFNFGPLKGLKDNLPLLSEGEKQIKINIDIRY